MDTMYGYLILINQVLHDSLLQSEACTELLLIIIMKMICDICVHWWVKLHQNYQRKSTYCGPFLIHELTTIINLVN